MKKLKESGSTRTTVKVIRAIESGIRMQSAAETMVLSLDKEKEIRKLTNADIKAESAFLLDAPSDKKRRMGACPDLRMKILQFIHIRIIC